MKIALIGNIAQNAYLLAKGLRAMGIEADSFDQGGGYPLQVPYWQECDFDPVPARINAESEVWNWAARGAACGWQRPAWAKILGNDGADPWYDTQEDFEADLGRVIRGRRELRAEDEQERDLAAALQVSRTPPEHHAAVIAAAKTLPDWRSVRIVAQQYDLVVLCGQYAAFGPLLPRDVPFVAFEHGTMRYAPTLITPTHRLMSLAYQQADANVITNADCWEAAGMLGVRDTSVFIPHPLDVAACTAGDEETDRVRAAVRRQLGCELVFLAPARWSRSEATGSKRNDRILYAYRRYVDEAEPAGAPRAALVFAAWGHPAHVREAELLVDALGLAGRVAWLPCLPKPRLLRWYRAADVVLDQFSAAAGSFGAVTAEALAVGRPVVTYYSAEAHRWAGCRDVLRESPPVLSCRTADEIYDTLLDLARYPWYRDKTGAAGREWICHWHTLERVCGLHLDLYTRLLRERGAAGPEAITPTVEIASGSNATNGVHSGGSVAVIETDCGPVGVGAGSR